MSARIVWVFVFFLSAQLTAQEFFTKSPEIVVHPSEIAFDQDGMFYVFKQQSIPIASLRYENCKYVATLPREIFEDILGTWTCNKCGWWNSRFDTACIRCGEPK